MIALFWVTFFICSILLGLFNKFTVFIHLLSYGCVKSYIIREISHTIITPYFVPVTACGEFGMKTVWVRTFFPGISGEYSSNTLYESYQNQKIIIDSPVVAN